MPGLLQHLQHNSGPLEREQGQLPIRECHCKQGSVGTVLRLDRGGSGAESTTTCPSFRYTCYLRLGFAVCSSAIASRGLLEHRLDRVGMARCLPPHALRLGSHVIYV